MTSPTSDDLLPVAGIALGTAAARIKDWDRDDVTLVVAEPGTVAAGVFTQNRFCAAPVTVCRDHLARQRAQGLGFRALVVNAGNANAGTGKAGLADALGTCRSAAELLGCAAESVLVFSTGVIMEPLPAQRIATALPAARRAATPFGWSAAARGIMTTDTVPKGASRRLTVDGQHVTITGIAKGAGMIHPDMATMLALVATDAPIAAPALQWLVGEVAEVSFNCTTVDGDTSTNDSFVVAATGRAAIAPLADRQDPRIAPLRAALEEVAVTLAKAIARDGEGATKFITIRVEGGRDAAECRQVAFAIAHSPLVKTAFFASDPNLGRIVCAIGNAAVDGLDPSAVSFRLGDVLVVDHGARAASYTESDGRRVMAQRDIGIAVALGRGAASAEVWTCDLSHDYVSINADYRS